MALQSKITKLCTGAPNLISDSNIGKFENKYHVQVNPPYGKQSKQLLATLIRALL